MTSIAGISHQPDVSARHAGQEPHLHGGPPRNVWLRGGWLRAFWLPAVLSPASVGLIIGLRKLWGFEPVVDANVNSVFALLFGALGFIIGIGCFDYWWGYIIGRPTPEHEDHSSHGAYSWRDYFKVNTDHKVIGVQYLVATFAFFLIGGALAEGVRAELSSPGDQYFSPSTYNGLFSVHASLMIFLFIIPAFAGLGNYVIP